MATNYQRGRAFEYRARDQLLKKGAVYVMRAASSKGAADLIALFPPSPPCVGLDYDVPHVWLVQCKRDGRLPKDERETLIDLAERTGASAVLAKTGPKGRGIEFVHLTREES